MFVMSHPAYIRAKARELRIERRLTIDEIAERLALPRGTIYYWVRDLPLSEREGESMGAGFGDRAGACVGDLGFGQSTHAHALGRQAVQLVFVGSDDVFVHLARLARPAWGTSFAPGSLCYSLMTL